MIQFNDGKGLSQTKINYYTIYSECNVSFVMYLLYVSFPLIPFLSNTVLAVCFLCVVFTRNAITNGKKKRVASIRKTQQKKVAVGNRVFEMWLVVMTLSGNG